MNVGPADILGLKEIAESAIENRLRSVPRSGEKQPDPVADDGFAEILGTVLRDGPAEGGDTAPMTGVMPGPTAAPRMSKRERDDRKLMETCTEMESLFVSRMLKEMRKNVEKSGWINGGHAEQIFEDMLYDEYAMSLSKNASLGLAKMLYRELSAQMKDLRA